MATGALDAFLLDVFSWLKVTGFAFLGVNLMSPPPTLWAIAGTAMQDPQQQARSESFVSSRYPPLMT